MLVPAALGAQSVATTYSVDINGHSVPDYSVATATEGKTTEKMELSESINGRLVPKEQTARTVLSETSSEKVTESIDRKFSQTGQLISTERVVTTERKMPGGGSSTTETVYRSDVNGSLQEAERRSTETVPQGTGVTASDVTIARPSANGGFEKVEERKIVKSVDKDHTHEEQTVYLKATSGNLVETRRTLSDSQTSGEKTEATVANYETDYTGRMALLSSENNTTTLSKDGTAVTERNIYSVNALGTVRTGEDGQKIREQQIIVRTPSPDGSVKETINVRRPTISDPTVLGSPTQISETVCTGKCEPEKP
jgi:hypothetical protein